MSRDFSVYALETGEIVRILQGPKEFIEANVHPGEGVIEGAYAPGQYRITDGHPLKKSVHEIEGQNAPERRRTAYARRDAALSASDWTQLPDVPVRDQQAWARYRQALRDLPEQAGWPESVEWPTPPDIKP